MPTANELRELAKNKGFEDWGNGRYGLDELPLRFIVFDITERSDGSFHTWYNQQKPHPQARYSGKFGPQGGRRNYAAHRTVQVLSNLPSLKSKYF